jgi:hypothetical protein
MVDVSGGMLVACKCGWRGSQDALKQNVYTDDKFCCPVCYTPFHPLRLKGMPMKDTNDTFLPSKPKLLKFNAKQEPWAEYELEDGSIVRVRVVMVKVIEDGKFDEQGYPVHQLKFNQLIDVIWTDTVEAEAAQRRAAK